MSYQERVEEEDLLEGQRIFNGPRKLGEFLFGSPDENSSDEESG
ncbi:hypothetical protein [Haloarcula sp. CBA1127]|nr:hypothetical protein [Haloarcula sp. CBA1127]